MSKIISVSLVCRPNHIALVVEVVIIYFWFNRKTNYLEQSNTKIKLERGYSNKTK